MKQVALEAINRATVALDPTDHVIVLTSVLPYLTLDSIDVPDRRRNSHQKTFNGTYYGTTPTSIRIRNHYPHSISNDWTPGTLSNIMYSDFTYEGLVNYRLSLDSAFKFGSCIKYDLTPGATWQACNGAWDKEECFYGTQDKITSIYGYNVNYATYYTNGYSVFRAKPDEADYYYDDGEVDAYPYSSPSSWVNATINSRAKTWSCDVTMNQFWHNDDASRFMQMQRGSPARKTDDRLQFIEIEMNFEFTYEGETYQETATRVYYVWHCPQNWGNEGTLGLKYINGLLVEPYGGRICNLGLGLQGCQYDYGWSVAGGEFDVNVGGVSLDYSNIALEILQPHNRVNLEDPPLGVINPPYVSLEWTIENISQIKSVRASYDPPNPHDPILYHDFNISRMSLVDGMIYSTEFQEDFVEFSSMPFETEYTITFTIDFSNHILGNTGDLWYETGGGSESIYGWVTKSPTCSQNCRGLYTASGGIIFYKDDDTYLEPAGNWVADGTEVYGEIQSKGSDIEPAELEASCSIGSVHIFAYASDGGRTRLQIDQDLTIATPGLVSTLPAFGTSTTLNNNDPGGTPAWGSYSTSVGINYVVGNQVEGYTQTWYFNPIALEWQRAGDPYPSGIFYSVNFTYPMYVGRDGLSQ